MATHDYVLDNATGANFRSDLNNALAAIVSNNSSSSEPSTKYAYQWWADTNEGVLKIRNSSNDGWVTLLQLDGTLTLEDGSNSAPALGFRDDLNTGIFSSAADTLDITCGGTTRGSFSSSGLTVTGNVTATTFVGNIDAVDGDFDGTLEADAITVAGTALSTVIEGSTLTQAAQTNITSLGTLTGLTLSGDMTFTGDSANIVFDKSDSQLEFADNAKAEFGTGGDLEIFHDGTNNIINDAGSTKIKIQRGGSDVWELKSTGLQGIDNQKLILGTSDDLQIFHDGSNSVIKDSGTGNLQINLSGLRINDAANNEKILHANENGAVELYFDNSKKLETTSSGVSFSGDTFMPDNEYAHFGTGNDMYLGHSGSVGSLSNVTGNFEIFTNEYRLKSFSGSNETMMQASYQGEANLWYDNVKRFETTSSGINVIGAITVNGSALSTGGGKVLQVISSNKPDQFSNNSTSFVDVASLSVDITAASSSNKMLVTVHVFANCEDAAILRLMFDSTPVGNGQAGSDADQQGFAMVRQDDGNLGSGYGIQLLHTPGDTSQHTYKIQARTTTSSHTININRRADSGFYSLSSSITVEEIAA